MRIVVVVLVLLLLFFIKAAIDKKKYQKQIRYLLEMEWGYATREEYSESIMSNISCYHRENKQEYSIDEITWNDLNMDEVYQRINHTRTSAGEEMLYSVLRNPVYSEKILEEREQMVSAFQKNTEQRMNLEAALYEIGKTDKISVYRYLNRTDKMQQISAGFSAVLCIALLATICLIFLASPWYVLFLCALVFLNVFFYYGQKAKIINDMPVLEFILATVCQCRELSEIQADGCEKYINRLCVLGKKFNKYSRFHFLVSGGNSVSGSIFDAVFDYVRMLFHVDLIKIAVMIQEAKKYQKELLEIYEIIGYLDSMLAIASYRDGIKEYCIPTLFRAKQGEEMLELENGYHPLITEPVKNTIAAKQGVLLTGSNASGKSTFLKMTAINAIFAQTLHTVLADAYRACYFRVYSSMALRDDILSKESYFIVEIKSLHRIFEQFAKTDIPVLCFVDEILRGTNTVERVAASSQLLEEISKKRALCFAATHDMELTYLLDTWYDNYHFEETVCQEEIQFDYVLHAGRADSKNAIRLLKMFGFSETVIQKAQRRAEAFQKEGIWK